VNVRLLLTSWAVWFCLQAPATDTALVGPPTAMPTCVAGTFTATAPPGVTVRAVRFANPATFEPVATIKDLTGPLWIRSRMPSQVRLSLGVRSLRASSLPAAPLLSIPCRRSAATDGSVRVRPEHALASRTTKSAREGRASSACSEVNPSSVS